MNTIHMDAMEQMALDLEEAQRKRHAEAGARQSVNNEEAFWTHEEMVIFRTIKTFRESSKTYDADNYRERRLPISYGRMDLAKRREEIQAATEKYVMEQREKGVSNRQIARVTGLTESSVRRMIKKHEKGQN